MRRVLRSAVTLAFFSALATAAMAQQTAAPQTPPPLPAGTTDGFFKTSDGVNIHYLLAGNSGSWVVLIHGYSDSAQRMWFTTGIAPEIAKHHRVVALDNRNHGRSESRTPPVSHSSNRT